MAKMQFVDFSNLALYDELIKGYIATEDAKSIKTVALDGNKLKFYKVTEPVGETAPAYEIELPRQDLSNLLEKFDGATAGDVVIIGADGKVIVDSGIKLNDLASKDQLNAVEAKANANAQAITAINDENTGILKQAKDYADSKDAAIAEAKKAGTDAQADLNAFKDKVGEIPADKTVMGMIQQLQADAYDDTEVRGLIQDNADAISALDTRVGTAEDKITKLVGTDSNKSVREIANEELAAQLIPEGAKESLDTLQEIAAWIQSHPDDASAMNTAITNLEKLVGTIPEGVTATNIVDYIQEVVKTEKDRIDALTDRMTAAETDIDNLQAAIAEGGSVDLAIKAVKQYTDDKIGNVGEEKGTVTARINAIEEELAAAETFTPVSEAEIRSLFA